MIKIDFKGQNKHELTKVMQRRTDPTPADQSIAASYTSHEVAS